MPKRDTAPPLSLSRRPAESTASGWLYSAVRAEILEGRLRPGTRLPSTRALAIQEGLSRGTIVAAFNQLHAEGYVAGSVGSGTRVSDILPEDRQPIPHPPDRGRPAAQRALPRGLAAFAQRLTLFQGYEPRALRAFRANQPALDRFPTTLWAQVAARRLRRATPALLLGTDPMGYPPLREAVSDYLRASRGVSCEARQVAIVSGAQEALDLVARLVLDPGSRVAIEDPGYVGAARVFEAAGATLRRIPVDDEGISINRGEWRSVRLAYVTPAHQFPLGIAMSLPRRLALLEWARRSGALIFEDDYDGEYRYGGRPVPALQGLDRYGVVCFSGTFSKVMFPSLRLGYLIVPPDLIDRVAAAKSVTTRHAPLLDQAILADFITEGHFGRHIRKMRQIYAERLGVLLSEGRARLQGLLDISDIEAGLQTVGWLSGKATGLAAERAAAERGVEVLALSRYAGAPLAREGLHLGFAAVDEKEIRRGVRELEHALGGLARRTR